MPKAKKIKKRTFSKRTKSELFVPKKMGQKMVTLREKLQQIYGFENLATTCPGHCVCCNVACPQMNYSEFLVIVDSLYRRETRSDRMKVLKQSIRYFFSNSLVKPCPLLVGKKCSVYMDRPLSCRMYGQWPKEMYEERVSKFSEATGLKPEEIPLNTQCEYVRRVDSTKPLTKEIVNALYDAINIVDKGVGNYSDGQIAKRHNQRTWHDWFMVTVFGEERLSSLSNFFLVGDKEAVEDLAEQMCVQVDAVGDDLFGAVEKHVNGIPYIGDKEKDE